MHPWNTAVYRIDTRGDTSQIGVLESISDGYRWVPASPSTQPLKFIGLPWFIQDMRPEGFIGRAFARRVSPEMHLPEMLQEWSDEHLLLALSRFSHDCMGNLIVGEEALTRYHRYTEQYPDPISAEEVQTVYPRMALAAMDGEWVGCLAGGEQPKFTAVVTQNGDIRNVLVKFSPIVTTPVGRRWADLLVCEHLALETISAARVAAAQSTLVFAAGRVFLEVERFDRVGQFGRYPINSLGVIDDEFFGYRDTWVSMAGRLESAGMVEHKDAEALRWLWAFGEMIANTDMHFGNASLILRDAIKPTFTLAPAYDMLPTLYRPRYDDVLPRDFSPPKVASMSKWDSVRQHALSFWEAAANDERISAEFREICARNHKLLRETAFG